MSNSPQQEYDKCVKKLKTQDELSRNLDDLSTQASTVNEKYKKFSSIAKLSGYCTNGDLNDLSD